MSDVLTDETTTPPLFQSEARRNIRYAYINRKTFDNSDVDEFDFEAWWQAMGFRDDHAANAASLLGVTDRHIRQLRHKDPAKRPAPSKAFVHQCLLHLRLRDAAELSADLVEAVEEKTDQAEAVAIRLADLVQPESTRGYLGGWW